MTRIDEYWVVERFGEHGEYGGVGSKQGSDVRLKNFLKRNLKLI